MSTSSLEIRGKKKKGGGGGADEYTASREDLLIGGSLSPSVVELRPNPSLWLNETVKITHDGSRQHPLEWLGRMRSTRKAEESIQGLLPLSTLPRAILAKAETRAEQLCCDR